MRLILASSLDRPEGLTFQDFPVSQLPPYAILSHTWGEDEVVWEDFVRGSATGKTSFSKIRHSCLQTIRDGLEWVWIDSSCIDKSSSAELSEAINSMYEWYQRADICYAHLEGVSATVDVTEAAGEFAGCRWFTRGWTLQELLASREVAFYSEDWARIGDKAALSWPLSTITGIEEDILTGAKALESASIAKRMSWAAHRKTTRSEDIAYCLMGIFGVNMPMLYGEGDKAFLRLQEEIMKQSDDQSLFAWVNDRASAEAHYGLLAKSPLDFAYSSSVMPYQDWEPRLPYQLTNRGLRIEISLAPHDDAQGNIFMAALDCPAPPDYEDSSFLAVYLQKVSHENHQYVRIRAGQFAKVKQRGRRQTIYVKQNTHDILGLNKVFPSHIFQLREGPPTHEYKAMTLIMDPQRARTIAPKTIWSSRAAVRAWLPEPARISYVAPKAPRQLVCAVMFERVDDGERVLVLLGTSEGLDVKHAALELPAKSPLDDAPPSKREFVFERLQELFDSGGTAGLALNELTVGVNIKIVNGSKYYLIDIGLRNTKKPNRIERVIDAGQSMYERAVEKDCTRTMPPGDQPLFVKKSKWRRFLS